MVLLLNSKIVASADVEFIKDGVCYEGESELPISCCTLVSTTPLMTPLVMMIGLGLGWSTLTWQMVKSATVAGALGGL